MKLAVNYSTALHKLIESEKVKVDLLKCPEWDGLVRPAMTIGQVYIHFEIALGANKVQHLNFDLIRRMLKLTGTKFINTHLSNAAQHGSQSKKDLLANWEADLAFLRKQLPEMPFIAENLPWHSSLPQLKLASDPELISQFLINNDVGLLLDLSHAQITAAMSGVDYRDYVTRLPLERLEELHITGIREYNGSMTDHFEMQEHDWPIAEWAASQIHSGAWKEPEIVAFEYGGVGDVFCWRTEESALLDQVPRLYQLFGERP